MPQVIQRVWRSGSAEGETRGLRLHVSGPGREAGKVTDASWSGEDAEKALAARLLNLTPPPTPDPAIVAFKQMTERYLSDKEAPKKTINSDRRFIAPLF